MAKPKFNLDALIAAADEQAAEQPGAIIPEAPIASLVPAPDTPTLEGYMRVRILTEDHTDGLAKKTWLQNSVVNIDRYTAQRMINAGWAAPTTAPINEILLEYKGKK